MSVEIRILGRDDESVLGNVGPDVFDDPVHAERAREFLSDPRHHLVVAIESGVVVGFVSAVHYVHPDKPHPELWINEVGVAATHRGRGVGKAMLQSVLEVGRRIGCGEAWVLTERSNAAAMRLYASGGGTEGAPDGVMFTFYLDA
ncbi:MAG TPA: GNAT family N-acetyltransferase [Blastocatellia bacterium]|nr:GNAT family N-acetyltransferase [Blastocatellia bacterium]